MLPNNEFTKGDVHLKLCCQPNKQFYLEGVVGGSNFQWLKTSGSQRPAQFVTHGSPSPKHAGVCVSGETEEEEQSAAFTKGEQAWKER